MNRHTVSAILATLNIVAILWFTTYRTVHAGTMFAAILVAVIGSAIVQRMYFKRDAGWRAKFDPVVMLSFIVCFDVTLAIATIVGRS